MHEAIEDALMFYAMNSRYDTPIEEWSESRFNQTMTFLVKSWE